MKNTSPIHEMQVVAGLLCPKRRAAVSGYMGSWGARLFSDEKARYCWRQLVVSGNSDVMQWVSSPDAPEGLEEYILSSLRLLDIMDNNSEPAAMLHTTVGSLADLAERREMVAAALANDASKESMQRRLAGMPSMGAPETPSFCARLKERFKFHIDNIGLPQTNLHPTTWPGLNHLLQGGFRDEELILIAGRPGMGKTAFALCVAVALSLRGGVDFYSLEMGEEQLMDRLLAMLCSIPQNNILLPDQRLAGFQRTVDDFSARLNLRIIDTPGLSLSEMLTNSRGRVPFIDYVGLIPGLTRDDNYASRQLQVGAMSRAAKQWARAQKRPVFLLSQLNRGLEKREDKRPIPSDLRNSGTLEQDADKVLLMYRDAVYAPDARPDLLEPHIAEVIVGKQRNGPIGTVYLQFQPVYGRFVEPENWR